MTSVKVMVKSALISGLLVVSFSCPPLAHGQGSTGTPNANPLSVQDSNQMYREIEEKNLHATNADPAEAKAYNAFHDANAKETDKKIKLGQEFVAKYPSSPHDEYVYVQLAQLYYSKQDVDDFYSSADKAIALNPNDPTILAMTSWVAPRAYHRDDPFAEGRLDKAEQNAKHAIEILTALPKPDAMSDEQFAQFKNEELATAHSGLGLVHFRRGNLEESVKELELATQSGVNADPTDYYVLGAAYQNLSKFKEASDAFNRCAATSGPLQQDCKANAAASAKMAVPAK
jgi:tetratricopeptide (TPR) repeat protein